ncbi:hypothetical protein KCH_41390 [Kitasatospora cheerisanensis KCTC 2395]|uniref:Uncharacterized protein n=1 Tax=Kitasatospora cheerisanensis KCTC 2395 TaxID=1348663 RepID=A0A066YS14_9ACTN|nr:hypothetical protein KCH_41390 [Kitasatospora cheerisanensis KCTC 2395]
MRLRGRPAGRRRGLHRVRGRGAARLRRRRGRGPPPVGVAAGVSGPAGVPAGVGVPTTDPGTCTGVPGTTAAGGVGPGACPPGEGAAPGDAPSTPGVPPCSPRDPPWWPPVPTPALRVVAVAAPLGFTSSAPSGDCAPTDMQPLSPSRAIAANAALAATRRCADPTAITEPPPARPARTATSFSGAQRASAPPGHGCPPTISLAASRPANRPG